MTHRSLQNRRKTYHQAGRNRDEEQTKAKEEIKLEKEKSTATKIEVKSEDLAGVVATIQHLKNRG